jgi:hypothetical protein
MVHSGGALNMVNANRVLAYSAKRIPVVTPGGDGVTLCPRGELSGSIPADHPMRTDAMVSSANWLEAVSIAGAGQP